MSPPLHLCTHHTVSLSPMAHVQQRYIIPHVLYVCVHVMSPSLCILLPPYIHREGDSFICMRACNVSLPIYIGRETVLYVCVYVMSPSLYTCVYNISLPPYLCTYSLLPSHYPSEIKYSSSHPHLRETNMGHYIVVQRVAQKTRLEMLNAMVIEILNGGEILVNCEFK